MEKRKLERYRKVLLQKRAQILERFFRQEETQKVIETNHLIFESV